MADIFLSEYNTTQSLNGYNAPHKYRFALKKGMKTEDVLKIWNLKKSKVLNELVCKLNEFDKEKVIFATAPSRMTFFVNDINAKIHDTFTNSIDISNCFVRDNGFDAGVTEELLTDEELRGYFHVDRNCCNNYSITEETPILLLDDVYANGNTLRGMRLALEDVGINNDITTAVILKV